MRLEDLQTLAPRENKRVGAILGLAVGDALGATYEFCHPSEILEGPLEMVGGGWLHLEPGETIDDTALAKAVLTAVFSVVDLCRMVSAYLLVRRFA